MLHDLDGLPTVVVLAGSLFVLLRKLTHLPLLTGEDRPRRRSTKGQNCLLRWRPGLLPLETPVVPSMGVGKPNGATSIGR